MNTCHFSQRHIERITERSRQTTISFPFSTCQIAHQYLHCTTKLTLYLRTDIDIELHSDSERSTFATCIVYKLHCGVGSVFYNPFRVIVGAKSITP